MCFSSFWIRLLAAKCNFVATWECKMWFSEFFLLCSQKKKKIHISFSCLPLVLFISCWRYLTVWLQALFGKLQQLATVAGDVLVGREKIQKTLLARLTLTVVMWLSDEQEFWGVLEDQYAPLQAPGLQQVVFYPDCLLVHFFNCKVEHTLRNVNQQKMGRCAENSCIADIGSKPSNILACAQHCYFRLGVNLDFVLDSWY